MNNNRGTRFNRLGGYYKGFQTFEYRVQNVCAPFEKCVYNKIYAYTYKL